MKVCFFTLTLSLFGFCAKCKEENFFFFFFSWCDHTDAAPSELALGYEGGDSMA